MTLDLTKTFEEKIPLENLHEFSIPTWDHNQDYYYVATQMYANHNELINEAYRLNRLLGLSFIAAVEKDDRISFYSKTQKDSFTLFSLLCGNGNAEFSFTIDLPYHVVNWKMFQKNFQRVCIDHNILANFEMDTIYVRRIRLNTNSTDNTSILMRLHENGAFNVGLHHKAIQILPEFRT